METKTKLSKVQKALKTGEIITFGQLFAQDLKEGVFTIEEYNKAYKEELEENARLLRAETAKKVKKARLEMQVTQEELAKKLHTKKSFISEIENGKQNISIEYASKIAKALNKDLVWRFK